MAIPFIRNDTCLYCYSDIRNSWLAACMAGVKINGVLLFVSMYQCQTGTHFKDMNVFLICSKAKD